MVVQACATNSQRLCDLYVVFYVCFMPQKANLLENWLRIAWQENLDWHMRDFWFHGLAQARPTLISAGQNNVQVKNCFGLEIHSRYT